MIICSNGIRSDAESVGANQECKLGSRVMLLWIAFRYASNLCRLLVAKSLLGEKSGTCIVGGASTANANQHKDRPDHMIVMLTISHSTRCGSR